MEAGRFVSYRRNPDWWGADLPFNRGQQNFDEVRYEGYGPGGTAVIVEALTDNRNRTASVVRSVFTKAGGFVSEFFVRPETRGNGSIWDLSFSKDIAQRYVVIVDGENNVIWIELILHLFEATESDIQR